MPPRNLIRRATVLGIASPNVAPIYVDSDDDIIKSIPAGTGTTEVEVIDATHAQTISGVKTFTGLPLMTADGGVQFAEVSLTSANLLALRATPITLVAAPGAGKLTQFLGASLFMDSTATAYTESADNLVIRYQNTTGDVVSEIIETTGFIDQTTDQYTQAIPVIDPIVAKAVCENTALVLHNNGDGELAVGTGVLRVKIWFMTVATGW